MELKGCYWSKTIRKYFWNFCISTPKRGTKMWHIYAYVNRNTTTKSLSSLATWYHPTMERALDSPPPTDWHRFSFFFFFKHFLGSARQQCLWGFTRPLPCEVDKPCNIAGWKPVFMNGFWHQIQMHWGCRTWKTEGGRRRHKQLRSIHHHHAGTGAVQEGQRCAVYHYKVPS